MIDWLIQTLTALPLNPRYVFWGVVLSLLTFVGSIVMVSVLLTSLPSTYFQSSHDRNFWMHRHRIIRLVGLVAKNLVGVVMVVLGLVMSLPGVPGQGILTVLLGVMLLDFPGKRRLEYTLVSQPKVLHTINRLRGKFGKPPLVLD